MDNSDITLKDFIGIFPGAASTEYCERVINRYEYIQESQSAWGDVGRGKIWNRQQEGADPLFKDNDTYLLGGGNADYLPVEEKDIILMQTDLPLLREYNDIIAECYKIYATKYGALGGIVTLKPEPAVRIQKYTPTQGFHLWHCDCDGRGKQDRVLTVALYLNTVEEGGETELLHQSIRIQPIRGTMALFPAGWTHMHRGNPPLKGNKYFMTTWLNFLDVE